ncbi:putative polysaccharide biosynthesis protein [Hespellia stercorisuis]|uniref:Stage V sporulation protein B n=1 Tax=Hespellia stercorisuis DSM 15480 TaxID=1121950 RepID=A0A1M6N565_9FIRM|nr:polysaccharide biosynthesis protein [Hespellia stercorisuis]SHJ90753.1 stage V sporulation protein B [Hespellia stercorisuis DSM 15480]
MSRQRKKRKENEFMIQGAILSAAAVITKIIGVAYRIPLTNILGDEGNGFYSYAFEVYAIALLMSSFSLPLAVSKLMSARIARGQRRNAFRVFLCALIFAVFVGAVVAIVIFFGADVISAKLLSAPLSAYALRVLAPGLFIVAVMGVVRGYFQGLGNMIPTAVSQVIEQFINAIISIVGAIVFIKFGTSIAEKKGDELIAAAYGAAGGTLGTVMGALAALIFLLVLLYGYRKTIKKQIRMDQTRSLESAERIFKILLLTIAPVIMSTGIYNINQVLDQVLFNKIMAAQGFTKKEYISLMGIYSGKYNTLINVPLAIANALGASVIPSLTGAITRGDRKLAHEKIAMSVRFAMIIAIPCCAGFIVLASPLMQLLFGDSRPLPALMLAVGAVTVVLYSLSTVTNAILQGINQMMAPVKNAAISLFAHLAALLIMLVILKWSIFSIVAANVIFSLLMCVLNARDIRKANGYRQERDKTFYKPITASVIMGVITYAVRLGLALIMNGKIATILSILVAVIVYAISLLKLGALTEEEILEMPKGQVIVRICKRFHLLNRQIF